jgi:calnexin
MRFNAALASALVSSAGLMGYVHAEDEVPAPDATSAVERPTFTVRGHLVSLFTLLSVMR